MINPTVVLGRRRLSQSLAAVGVGAAIGMPRWMQSASAASVATRLDAVALQQSASSLAALEAAVAEMQARSAKDPKDPKGWLRNATAHAEFCARPGVGEPGQIHFCWWFLSWHRAFIVVTERKLREIAKDPTLAFPYWNWSTDRRLPKIFNNAGPLSIAERQTPNRDVRDVEVDYYPHIPERKKLGVAALSATSFEAKDANSIQGSFGGIASPNPSNTYGNSRLEGTPHGPIHNYIGGDMGDFETAARDPVFFAHHGNLDRLWEIWRQDPARKATEPSSKAFVEHVFPFTWLDGKPTTISVAETLDTRKLGYVYDSLAVMRPMVGVEVAQGPDDMLPPIASKVVALPAVPTTQPSGSRRLLLSIEGVETPTQPITVGVFLKAIGDNSVAPGLAVGSFAAVMSGGRVQLPDTNLRFDITDVVAQLGGAEFQVLLRPFDLARGTPYAPLSYRNIQITTP